MGKKQKPIAPESFTRGVLKEVRMRFATHRKHAPYDWVDAPTIDGIPYTILGLLQDRNVYWAIHVAGSSTDFIGGGWFRFDAHPRRVLTELRAAIHKAYRGKGLYPLILKRLRIQYRRPLESDLQLSGANKRALEKLGKFNKYTRRFRINPAPLGVVDQIRYAWLVMEGLWP